MDSFAVVLELAINCEYFSYEEIIILSYLDLIKICKSSTKITKKLKIISEMSTSSSNILKTTSNNLRLFDEELEMKIKREIGENKLINLYTFESVGIVNKNTYESVNFYGFDIITSEDVEIYKGFDSKVLKYTNEKIECEFKDFGVHYDNFASLLLKCNYSDTFDTNIPKYVLDSSYRLLDCRDITKYCVLLDKLDPTLGNGLSKYDEKLLYLDSSSSTASVYVIDIKFNEYQSSYLESTKTYYSSKYPLSIKTFLEKLHLIYESKKKHLYVYDNASHRVFIRLARITKLH